MAVKKPAPKPAAAPPTADVLSDIYNQYRTGVQSDTDAIARRLQGEQDRAQSAIGSYAAAINGPRNLAQEVSAAPVSQATMARTNLLSGAGNALQASRGRELGAKTGLTSMLSYLQKVGELQKQQNALQQQTIAARARASARSRAGGGKDTFYQQLALEKYNRQLQQDQEKKDYFAKQEKQDALADFLGLEGKATREEGARRIAALYGKPEFEQYLLDFAETIRPRRTTRTSSRAGTSGDGPVTDYFKASQRARSRFGRR